MSFFIINNETIDSLKALKKHAEENPYSTKMLEEIIENKRNVPGDIKGFRVFLPGGFKVVLTIEKQKIGKVRHMSMSINKEGELPNPYIVEEVAKILGFEKHLSECLLEIEDITPCHQAINVLEIIEK